MKYNVYYQKDEKINKIEMYAHNLTDLKNQSEFPKNVIRIKRINKITFKLFKNHDEQLELFYELKIMLNANLNFEQSIDILLQSKFSKENNKVLKSIKYALENGQSLYKSLKQHEQYLGSSTLLFFQIAGINANFKTSINALYEVLYQNHIIRKKLIATITYPLLLLVSLLISIFIILYFVIPKFEFIFSKFTNDLPFSTVVLLDLKYILSEYYVFISFGIFLILILINIMYKYFEIIFDKLFLLYIPIFSPLYRYILFYRLFLSIQLIVKSKYDFYEALLNSKNIIHNKYVLSKLEYILKDIKNGVSISNAFTHTKIFDYTTIRLLHTAQKTNTLEQILQDIINIYNEKLYKNIKYFSLILEPVLIFIIASIVLWLVLAIMTPIWDLSSLLK